MKTPTTWSGKVGVFEVSKKPNVPAKIKNNEDQKPVITVKEARKIIGKELSDKLSDEQLGRLIGEFSTIARESLEASLVPQKQLVI